MDTQCEKILAMNSVVKWFGESFSKLDPLLQDLHRNGGRLSGVVDIEFGRGLAGFIGRRLAVKLGLPTEQGAHRFEVVIAHKNGVLIWSRTFNAQTTMISYFVPQGVYPDGFWSETTGALALRLGVDIRDGGWYWVQRQVRFLGMPLPIKLFPESHAYKRINNGLYEFSVSFKFPILGKLVSYSGMLSPQTKIE